MNVMVIGSGGREHAIAWALRKSKRVKKVFCVPGNAGTALEPKCENIRVLSNSTSEQFKEYLEIARENNCSFAVIGSEEPLAEGVVDYLSEGGIRSIGPKKSVATLESSKDYAKHFMKKYGVSSGESKTFTDFSAAESYTKEHGFPIVIKADGLAAGKGVVIVNNEREATETLTSFMKEGAMAGAGRKVVIEEYLEGPEVSLLCAVSTARNKLVLVPFLPARDHKKLFNGGKGPNTGGMGAVCPIPDLSPEMLERIETECIEPTIHGLESEHFDYCGFLFIGLIITKTGPKVLEYNVRLGDPETEAVLPLMDFDFSSMCESMLEGTLDSFNFKWKSGFEVAPVVVSRGYPVKYETGKVINIDETILSKTPTKVFFAGAKFTSNDEKKNVITSGGRVLSVSSYGETFDEAFHNAYESLKAVSFEGATYRTDIGKEGEM